MNNFEELDNFDTTKVLPRCNKGLNCPDRYRQPHSGEFLHVPARCMHGVECIDFSEKHRKAFTHNEPLECGFGMDCNKKSDPVHMAKYRHSNKGAAAQCPAGSNVLD